jgi:hypothetical protein
LDHSLLIRANFDECTDACRDSSFNTRA